jgi:hypothetical protein
MNKTYEVCLLDKLPALPALPAHFRQTLKIIEQCREHDCIYGSLILSAELLIRGYNVYRIRNEPMFRVEKMKPADETIIFLIAGDAGYSLKEYHE